jgi:hypothetical protein
LPDFSVHRASELGREELQLFEKWLGRTLGADETISVNAWRPHVAPSGERMETLRHDIAGQAREIGLRGPAMDDDEADGLVEEARMAGRAKQVNNPLS